MRIKKFVLAIFMLSVSQLLCAQEPKFLFSDKPNQHSVSLEFPIAISYTFTHKFSPNIALGARLQGGLGLPITLLSTDVLYDYGYGDGPQEVKTRSYLEMVKLQLFYRHSVSNNFFLDVGPFGSLAFLFADEAGWENPFKAGIELSAYYSIRRIHIGLRINGALCFGVNDANILKADDTYYVLDVIPLVIGFSF